MIQEIHLYFGRLRQSRTYEGRFRDLHQALGDFDGIPDIIRIRYAVDGFGRIDGGLLLTGEVAGPERLRQAVAQLGVPVYRGDVPGRQLEHHAAVEPGCDRL